MAALQVINEVLLARGQAVPEWLCKSGYLEVSRTARQRPGSRAESPPKGLSLLLQICLSGLGGAGAVASPQVCSESRKASPPRRTGAAPADGNMGQRLSKSGWHSSRPRGSLDAEQAGTQGKRQIPNLLLWVCWCLLGVCSFPRFELGTSHQWLRKLIAPKLGTAPHHTLCLCPAYLLLLPQGKEENPAFGGYFPSPP